MKTIRIGSGAGYSGDRLEPALALMEHGDIHYIIFECLAERTIALAQLQKAADPNIGYNELLSYRMQRVLPLCAAKKIKVITNMGAANPRAALQMVKQIARSLGLASGRDQVGDPHDLLHEFNPALVPRDPVELSGGVVRYEL